MKHTPGKWIAKGAVILCPRGRVIASCEPTTVPMEQRRVNACLLAASPELLKKLQEAVELLEIVAESHYSIEVAIPKFKRLIKKAKAEEDST